MVGFFRKTLIFISLLMLLCACSTQTNSNLLETEDLQVEQLSENVFLHTSFIQTNEYGKVKCNGAIFKSDNEVIIIDTPTNDLASEQLIQWVSQELKCKIKAVIPTHFHDDCLGGIAAFDEKEIPSYAHTKTIQLALTDSIKLSSVAFDQELELTLSQERIHCKFFGAGHTFDNVVVYYPKEKTLFGGCLVKSIGAGKGYLGDADTLAWSSTIDSIQSTYDAHLVIPGHGKPGNAELLEYTFNMFESGGKDE